MREMPGLACAITAALMMLAQASPPSPPAGPLYVVTYVEVSPRAPSRVAALLGQYRDASRREAGNLGAQVLQRIDRPQHFAVIETWKDAQARESHSRSESRNRFVSGIAPDLLAPLDERLLQGVVVSETPPTSFARGTVIVLTHADALPPATRGTDLLRPLAQASRNDRGNLRFDVLQQPTRANHFTVVEVWASRSAFDAHAAAPHTREFREKFQEVTGSLYDERLYKLLD